MDWANLLKSELRRHAEDWADMGDLPTYNSRGRPGTLLFAPDSRHHGNLFADAYAEVLADSEWQSRLKKPHPQRKHLPDERQSSAMELDSTNSSDALLMNCFCVPGASVRLAAVLGASPPDARPQFGVRGVVRLVNGSADSTELDMVLGDTIVEAKLTEADFTSRPAAHLERYADFSEVFDREVLPKEAEKYRGFQLIRNVLAARQHGRRFVVLIDARRPDLLQEWWAVHAAIRSATLRATCHVRFWQELARAADKYHQASLMDKYGL